MKQPIFTSILKKSLLILGLSTGLAIHARAQTVVSVGGTVFNDLNRNTRIDAGESSTGLPAPMYVYLVRANIIREAATVAANGSYTLQATSGFTYTLEFSTQSYPIGNNTGTNPIDHNPPAGWVTTGENASGTNTGSGDLNANGIMQVNVGSSSLVARNFGITCKSAGSSGAYDICVNDPSVMPLADFISNQDQGGTWSYLSGSGITFNAAAGTIQLGANPTTSTYQYDIVGTGTCPSSSSTATVTIIQRPVTNQSLSICAGDSLCIVNTSVGSRTLAANEKLCYTTAGTYTDTLLNASASGCDSIVITTLTVNSCGSVDISGSIFNDANSNRIINAGETFSTLPAQLYVYLVNSDNIVVDSAYVHPNGSYTIQGMPNQNYILKLSTQQYPLGTKVAATAISTTPPTGWTTTGENGNNNTGNGDGTPDGSLALALGTNSVSNQNFGIASTTPLSVTLMSFDAVKAGTGVQLNWSTASEHNNKGFGIESSVNGNTWTETGFVNSLAEQGKSHTALTYNFRDNKATSGKNYYRLKQMDLDGGYSYSEVVLITLTQANALFVYPNPASEVLMIAGLEQNVILSIRNTSGQELSLKPVLVNGTVVSLDISHLPQGVYYIVVMDEAQKTMMQQLFIKQ